MSEKDQIHNTMKYLVDKRRDGYIEIVKTILTITGVMISLFATLAPKDISLNFCATPYLSITYILIPVSSLVVLVSGLYRLNYDTVQIHNIETGAIVSIVRNSETIAQALDEIDECRPKLSFWYKPSLYICQGSFLTLNFKVCFW